LIPGQSCPLPYTRSINTCFRYPHHKTLRGEAYLMYGVGMSVWVTPLSECLQYVEAGFQYNKQVLHILQIYGN
jgi:hypothetical protein